MSTTNKLIVFTSLSSEDIALKIAESLLESRCAVCINIIPKVRSIYCWKGGICDDYESQLIIKTREDRFEEVKTIIEELSGYEVPEILGINVATGAPAFLHWIDKNLEAMDCQEADESFDIDELTT